MISNTEFVEGDNTTIAMNSNESSQMIEYSVEWSYDEQKLLEESLVMYAGEDFFAKCLHIAARLRNKTTRDVAFRLTLMKKYNDEKMRISQLKEQTSVALREANELINYHRCEINRWVQLANEQAYVLKQLEAQEAMFQDNINFQVPPNIVDI
ncbi:hypothetical protein S245_032951 [Arachis hypogaea]